MTTAPPRTRLLSTGDGSTPDAFGPTEWGLLGTIALIWGSSFLFIAVGLESLPPGVITLARVALGTGALALVPRARKPVPREAWGRLAFLGVIWIGIPFTLFPLAQQYIDSSLAGMINSGVPVTSALWATVLLGRAPGRLQIAGIAVGFAGIVAISWPNVTDAEGSALGVGLVILAVVLYGLATNLTVPLQQAYGGLAVQLRAQLVALVVVAPFGLWQLPDATFQLSSVLAMIPLGVLGTGLAMVMMTELVGRAGAARGSVAIYFVPIVAIALGVLVRGESVYPSALAGTGLVLLGAYLSSRKEARTEAVTRTPVDADADADAGSSR